MSRTGTPLRGWRFVHPDDADPQRGPGLQCAAGRGIELVAGDAAVRQAVLLLLTTSPGERVMRPEYGCGLHRLAFSPNDDTTAGLAIHYVRQALDRFEPRITVLTLDAAPHPSVAARLEVALSYRVRATLHREDVRVAVDLESEVG